MCRPIPVQETFNKALEAFVNASTELLDAWILADHTGDYYSTDYPFDKSFEDVVWDIIKWRDTNKEQKHV